MTAITTQPHHRKVSMGAALGVAAVIAGAGILGVTWEANHDSQSQGNTTPLTTFPNTDYWKTPQYHTFQLQPREPELGSASLGGVDGHVPPAPYFAAGGLDGHVPPTAPPTYGGRVQVGE
jgi:hypothetical protein